MTLPVFLSASEPYNTRSREYRDSQNLLNVRESVRALAAHVLPKWPLVFGGHPTITPLVRGIAGRIKHIMHRDGKPLTSPTLIIFQSRLYIGDTDDLELVFTDSHQKNGAAASPGTGWRNASLLRMRYEMLARPDPQWIHPYIRDHQDTIGKARKDLVGSYEFAAAFFIGGMEGVEREFKIFRTFHPRTPAFPIASTGSAAKKLIKELNGKPSPILQERLLNDTSYSLLFEHLLPTTGKGSSVTTAEIGRAASLRYTPEKHIDPDELDCEYPSRSR